MIRSTGDYVQVSRDLRPRVLDRGRLASGERRVRRYIRHVGLVAALLTWSVTATVDRMNSASDIRELTLATATVYPTVNAHVNGGRSVYNCDSSEDHACGNIGTGFIGGGIDKAVTKRVTLSSTLQLHHTVIAVDASATTPSVEVQTNNPEVKTNRLTASMTGKVNVWGNLLVTVTGLVSKNGRGLSDRFTPVIGFDYAW